MSLEGLEAFAKAFDERTRLGELADEEEARNSPPIAPSRDPPR
jgi:hypothetical protein